MAERWSPKPDVVGSSPTWPVRFLEEEYSDEENFPVFQRIAPRVEKGHMAQPRGSRDIDESRHGLYPGYFARSRVG
jgi:hypothetical protein